MSKNLGHTIFKGWNVEKWIWINTYSEMHCMLVCEKQGYYFGVEIEYTWKPCKKKKGNLWHATSRQEGKWIIHQQQM